MERFSSKGKKDMKKRKLPSRTEADALALSFAFPVVSRSLQHMVGQRPVPMIRKPASMIPTRSETMQR